MLIPLKLLISYTFIHEIVHAEMYRKLLSISSTSYGNIDWDLVKTMVNSHNYPGLFDYYVSRTQGDQIAQHEMMGAHYINLMVNFLKQVYGNKYTNTEYLSVAWQGLKGTVAWNLLSEDQKKLYNKTYQDNYFLWEL